MSHVFFLTSQNIITGKCALRFLVQWELRFLLRWLYLPTQENSHLLFTKPQKRTILKHAPTLTLKVDEDDEVIVFQVIPPSEIEMLDKVPPAP